jgi:glycosyltransferase involved in cell wall biosynthesis
MRILLAHNFYQQPGGEDEVFRAEVGLLERFGHEVVTLEVHNQELRQLKPFALAKATLWNRDSAGRIRSLVRSVRPDVVHFHNTFPLLSGSAIYMARTEGVPVVQTLHNFRPLCANAYFFRDNRVCEDCLGRRLPVHGIVHSCYRGSRSASAGAVLSMSAHHILRWRDRGANVYIALTEFARNRFVRSGLPESRVVVKPNFLLADPGPGVGEGGFVLFAGRLTEEKGVRVLLDAWARLCAPIPLVVAGDGPLAPEVVAAAAADERIRYLGRISHERVVEIAGEAMCVLMPSLWYEGLPMVLVEAFARGTPVVASRIGALQTLVEPEINGVHVEPGDASALGDVVRSLTTEPLRLLALRHGARETFEHCYTAELNYPKLIDVYTRSIRESNEPSASVSVPLQA